MKNIFLFLSIIIFNFVFAQKHQQLPDDMKIRSLLSRQESAWNRGDIEDYMAGYWKSDSLTFIGKKGITKGWTQTLENYKRSYPGKDAMGTLKFDILSIELLSKTSAVVLGKWKITRSSNDPLEGYFTLLLKKINNIWQITLDHSS